MTDPTNQEMEELLALAKKRNQSIADDSNRSARKKAKASLGSSQSSNFNADQKDNDLASNYPYPVVPDDHCESPTEAYQDVASFLDAIAAQLGKTRKDLSIFDPYFCEGSMKERLQSLGFCNVRNEKKDFYQLIQTNTLPSFDVLVTNPPYSGDHMERLLRFCTGEQCRRPWFLLMPNYVYTKDYYSAIFGPSTAQARRTAPPPFYVTPVGSRRYLYSTPKGRRQEKSAKYTSPFPTFWYCQLYE